MNNGSKIFVAGANGMVGSAIIRELKKNGFNNLLTPSSKELDLRNQVEVSNFFETNVFLFFTVETRLPKSGIQLLCIRIWQILLIFVFF